MADPLNYLIGRGETLVSPIELASGGGQKAYPYSYGEAIARLSPSIEAMSEAIEELPSLACPNDEAVISVTLHPAFLAKTYHPTRLLAELGLRQVGSREQRILPEKWTRKEPPSEPVVAPELFVAGKRSVLETLRRRVSRFSEQGIQDDFRRIETIRALTDDRLKPISGEEKEPPLEIVLHADQREAWGETVLVGFRNWCEQIGVDPDFSNRQQVGGLAFLGLHVPRKTLSDFVDFAFIRTVRRMPRLTFRDVDLRSTDSEQTFHAIVPVRAPLATNIGMAIFDGGLPDDHDFGEQVVALDAPGVGAPVPAAVRRSR